MPNRREGDDEEHDWQYNQSTGHNQMPWSEQYRLAGEDWADKEAAAQLLEDTKSAVMAQRQAELGDIPVNRAEQTVKASAAWYQHIEKIVEARKVANVAKVQLEYIRMKAMERAGAEANQRTEMKLMGR